MYKVLWIDDQYNDPLMIQFAIEADNNRICLDGHSSFEEGFEALEKNLEKYDVILLDGLFFEKKGQEVGTEDESGIGMAIAKINELKSKKVFPWFVLSGKDAFIKSENSILKANKVRCFDKTNPSDILQLFEEIKNAAKTQSDFQLKHQYRNILEICNDKYIGANQFERVFSLIKDLENKERIEKTRDLLNSIRKIIESLFVRLGEIALIPKEILDRNGWINGSSRFHANKHNDYTHLSEFIHPMVAENLYRLINITQDGSHGEGELRLRVDEYLQHNSSDFLYKSTIYLLFDILMWFKEFIDRNGNVEENKKLWRSKTEDDYWIEGEVSMLYDNGGGRFQPFDSTSYVNIHHTDVSNFKLQVGDKIKVKTKEHKQDRIEEMKVIFK